MKQLNADNISGEAFQTVYDNINNQGKYLKKTFETEKERLKRKMGQALLITRAGGDFRHPICALFQPGIWMN